ncbi:unnamed protein product [Rhodiola kirilowii]
MPQSQPWKQSGFSELQLLQQQVMLKQMQEMQRQQQFQSFADLRQHSTISKNVEGVQCSPVINGTPVHSNSNMFTNWGQHSGSPTLQGVSSDGEAIQQYGGRSYDSPLASSERNLNQMYLQGIPGEHSPMFNKISGNAMQRQPVAHSLGFTHSFPSGQNLDSSNQAFVSRQDYSRNNVYGQAQQKFGEDNTFGSFEQANILTKNAMAYEINENEQGGWHSNQLDNNSMHISPSQGSATLDPLEEKILFSMDDNLWDVSSGKGTEIGIGNSGNALGSWSALMQSALAETSSSDTGMQEEWSGLTFQNTDPSTDNQTSNFVESGHQRAEYIENSLQPASALSVTEYQYLNSSGMNFPGFNQAVANSQSEQDRLLHSSHEHNQPFSKTGGRIDSNHQPSSPAAGKSQSQFMTQTRHGWASPNYGHGDINPSQLHRSSSVDQQNNDDFWSAQKAQSGTSGTIVSNNLRMNNFSSGPDSRTSLISMETQNQEHNQLAYAYCTNAADVLRDNGRMVNQHVSSDTPRALNRSYMQSHSNATELSSQGRSETNKSNALDSSMISQASNMGSQRSQNVLQLFQNINQSRVEGSLVHGSSISQGLKTPTASEAQYHNQSGSQGSSFPPTHPSPRFPNHNIMHASQNSWQKSVDPVASSPVPHQSQIQWQQISKSAVGSQPIQTALYTAATRYANAIASPSQNSPGSTHANPFSQQYTGFGAQSVSQLSVTSSLPLRNVIPSKPVNQWTAVPIQKHYAGAKSEIVQGTDSSSKHVEGMNCSPQNFNEQGTEHVTSSGSSAKPVIKYEDKKSQPHILCEVPDTISHPTSEMQESVENRGGHSEKNSSMNQMNILYGDQGDTIWSINTVADMTDQHLAITRPNKRKSRTSELLPWHKEVVKISVNFHDIRMGERDWAQATYQLMEVGNEADVLHVGQSLIRPRKRLLRTTRLMQKLLCTAPRAILSRNAASTYESVTYIVARLSLGDACNMSSAGGKTDHANKNDMEESMNVSRVVDSFCNRTKQMENDLQRFDKVPLIVDISVECQELERFSVINRFAKFHSRAQPNPSEPFSSGPQKMYPQRYVSASPMPKDFPDGVHCISL